MSRNKYPEKTEQLIISVAAKLFLEKGYENTSLNDIIKNLGGLTKGAIYSHFKSKEEIYQAVIYQMSASSDDAIEEIIKSDQLKGREKISLILNKSLDAAIENYKAGGKVDYSTTIAVTGSGVKVPRYLKATMGCRLQALLQDNLIDDDNKPKRIISGNVLTGVKENIDGYLHSPYRHVTVINEVNKKDEFMGWASLSPKKYSIYRDFTSWILGGRHKEVDLDAKLNGGERAIVMSGEYDQMLPMDIYAEFLIKAIIAFDIDKMEQLGIYEVAPEDFALAEYADTSKLELQRIVREGLDKMRAEMA